MIVIKRPKKKPNPKTSFVKDRRWHDPCPLFLSGMAMDDGRINRSRKYGAYFIGRELYGTELVHHVNGDTLDDSPQNLIVLASRAEHQSIHAGKIVKMLWKFDWDSYYEGDSV